MDIVILADFCGRFDGKDNSRFLYLAEKLAKEHEVEVVTGDFNHGTKSYFPPMSQDRNYKLTMLHEVQYSKNVSIKRLYSHALWGREVAKYFRRRKKPDVVYCGVPPLTGPYEAAKYCEKNGIRFIIDVQDLWPEGFRMVFHIPVISSLLFAPLEFLANGVYKRADVVCAVSQTYVDRALSVNKKCKSGHSVFLGTDLAQFDRNVQAYRELLVAPVELPEKRGLWLAYCGGMSESYDLRCVIDALVRVREDGGCVPILIAMGNGDRREEFQNYARQRHIDAVFTGQLPYKQMCGVLSMCDITVNPIAGGSAASIINKHADYAASGLPVLNTQESPEYRALVDTYQMGFNCPSGDVLALAKKIELLAGDSGLRQQMGANARRCAEERFDRAAGYSDIISLVGGGIRN